MMLAPNELGLLADDLTGACDLAACFCPRLGPVRVHVTVPTDSPADRAVSVINTQSRMLSPEQCGGPVQSAAELLTGRNVIFKKIDSALRGPVGAELAAMHEVLPSHRIIVAPAIPRIGKTTRHGQQLDDGIPIDQTDYARDPIWAIDTADVQTLVQRSGAVDCEVRDAEDSTDLSQIVDEALKKLPVIFVGSLGLAEALAERLAAPEFDRKGQVKTAKQPLIVCGSLYERARRQVEHAAKAIDAMVVPWQPQRPINQADALQAGDRPVIICLAEPADTTIALSAADLLAGFADQLVTLIDALQPDGLGVIGGDTAFALLSALGARQLTVTGRMFEVIACGVMMDGRLAGCPYTSKGGSVGPDDAVVSMHRYLTTGKHDD